MIGDVSVCNDVFPATRRRGGVRHPRDHFDKPDSQQRGGGGMIVVNNIIITTPPSRLSPPSLSPPSPLSPSWLSPLWSTHSHFH